MLFLLPLSIYLSNYNIDICLVNILKLCSSISINLTLCHIPSLPVWKIHPHSDTASQHLIYKPIFYSGHPPHNMPSWQWCNNQNICLLWWKYSYLTEFSMVELYSCQCLNTETSACCGNHQTQCPMISLTSKSQSWISSGEFTRELDKESLLN